MGITIHYTGTINNIKLIDAAIEEIKDITVELEWKYKFIDDDDLRIKGIYINPPKNCEALTFLFDKYTGVLKDRILLFANDMGEDHYKYNHTKTQYAPIEVHITIIKLLKYLKKKYIIDLETVDEGCYWETEDPELLRQKFAFLNEMMDIFEKELKKLPSGKNESAESIADKIELIFKKLNDKKN